MSDLSNNPRVKRLEIEAVEKTVFWQHYAKELTERRDKARLRACNLKLTADERTGAAGAATELDQLIEQHEQYKRELETQMKKKGSSTNSA